MENTLDNLLFATMVTVLLCGLATYSAVYWLAWALACAAMVCLLCIMGVFIRAVWPE